MGMDLLELVIEVEEAFGIKFADEELGDLRTVGEFFDCILSHGFSGRQDACMSSVTFYKLRRALMQVACVDRKKVRVPVAMEAIIPSNRRRTWKKLGSELGLRMPELKRPTVIVAITVIAFMITIFASHIQLWTRLFGPWFAIDLSIVTGGIATYLVSIATRPLAFDFPYDCQTVGGLTKRLVLMNYGSLSEEFRRADREEIWQALRRIVAEQLGVPLERVTRDARFAEDLGAE